MQIRIFDKCPEEAIRIRIAVFVDEQGFFDEFDEVDKIATHMLLTEDNGKPIATCRFFPKDDMGTYLIGRIAVVKEYRGKGIGAIMLRGAEKHIYAMGGKHLVIHAQCQARGFYEKCGYVTFGELDYEEGCPHIWMKKEIAAVHNMRLNAEPFDMIERGEKTIELRLYDEKRRRIRVGDIICFTHASDVSRTLERRVVALHVFPSFEDLYSTLPLDKCGYNENNISAAHPSDMEEYYSPDEQKKYGVVGIELDLI